jgi:GH15 family glucan-1,4-alpha-glucosidase
MADETVRQWRDPDHGIWEVRGGKRHFLHSKLMCWVALDRAVRLAESLDGHDTSRWIAARDEIRRMILKEGYDSKVAAFTQSFVEQALDASALIIPLTGLLPATGSASQRLDSEGNLTDEQTKELIRQLLQNLVEWTRRIGGGNARG